MIKDFINEYSSPLLEKPLREFSISCPLHYFAFDSFKSVIKEAGYELVHPEGIYFNRRAGDLIYVEYARSGPFTLDVMTTLGFSGIEKLFHLAFDTDYRKKHVLIEGRSSIRIHDSLNSQRFEDIRHTLPEDIVEVLENSLWNFEGFCNRFKGKNISPTLGILLYGPPGVGKTYVLRSYIDKLLQERNFTVVQIYQDCLNYINMSILLSSCRALFPCILFLEDIDMNYKDRSDGRMSHAGFLLETFEGLSQAENVALVATSNKVEVIEKALLRPGRIDYLLEVEKPSKKAKELVLSDYTEDLDLNLPLPHRELLVNGVDTFAELKGAMQHILRTYAGRGEFPAVEEIEKIIRTWKEARNYGVSETDDRKVGF